MTVWFIADTHFGEQPRGRQKASGMTAEQIDALIDARWRERVAVDDTVWHLGDIGTDWRRLADLPGTIHLILGNGDETWKAELAASPIFASVRKRHRLPVDGGSLFLIHKPTDAKREPAGEVVHGHLHALASASGHRSVSVDQIGWAPQSLEELLARGCDA